ncbi:polysaccharide deacetylase family protein [Solibacillus sp. MA9]|uniref:Polysaccharide deacetylase family protein n=1 Tax=Solibacillus palustris TaxID=2908203 RepID=A0ABS9UD63_9BACL|nr:polysaccharide deacetylase family protein [Solibacillus sp. MA9]
MFTAISVVYVIDRTSAEKGRKYYEDAGYIIWDIQTEKKVVALTFDDGPQATHTENVLNLLDQYDAKGTFFIVGQQAEKYPQIVRRMYETGHEIANHTYSHPYSKSVPKVMKEIEKTNEILYSITGFSTKLFRPVEGNYTDELVTEVAREGYKLVMWSWHLDTEDWKDPGVNKIVNTVLTGIEQGDVVLFHDGGGNREQTVQALEKILPELKKQGYSFVTISEMLRLQQAGK